MSVAMSTRPAAPLKRAPSPLSVTRSHSKSEQLAKAIADSQPSPLQPQFRPDSLWSEGGADVVWNGNGNGGPLHLHRDGFVSPPLPSPAGRSTHTTFSSNTDSSFPEFADADEGHHSDDDGSWEGEEGDTTMTTMSTMDSQKGLKGMPQNYPQVLIKAAPPARPKRKAPIRPDAPPAVSAAAAEYDEVDNRQSSYDHTRITSIGSSIWAGRGGKNVEDEAPPLPSLPDISSDKQAYSPLGIAAKGRQSVASSVYSQNPTTEYEESPRLGTNSARMESVGEQERDDGEFEIMNSSKVAVGEYLYDVKDGQRRLPDGTVVPKMPPMPSAFASNVNANGTNSIPRTRSKKGRQNRSPVLSYADGAEEEERLVQEREFREHGGIQGMEVTSSMGPRLKKNSPAPWEMSEGDRFEGEAPRSSHEGWGMTSRPSFDQLLPPTMKTPSTWARQSMESFRNRNASNGSQPSHYPPLPSSASKGSLLGFPSKEAHPSPTKSSMDRSSPNPLAENVSMVNRRSRSKSVSNSAAGMLKGLGLASSAAPAKKSSSSSKFGKAFRGMSAGARSSSSSNGGGGIEGKKSQGISSEDYAHLPPSPSIDQRHISIHNVDPFSTSSHRSDTDGRLMTSTSHGGGLLSSRQMVGSNVKATPTTDRLSSSNDSHAGTSTSGTATSTSQTTGGTSPGLGPANKGDLADILMSSNNNKYRDQSYTPLPKSSKLVNLGVTGGSVMTESSPSSSTSRLPSVTYKGSSTFGTESLGNSSPTKMQHEIKSNRSESATPTARPDDEASPLRPVMMSKQESNDATRGGGEESVTSMPSVGSLEHVPYKLISLQEARLQQQQQQQQDQQSKRTNQSSKDAFPKVDRSTSDKSMEQSVESREENSVPAARSLKNKKSGFLRMFGKDKGEGGAGAAGSEEGVAPPPGMPTLPGSFDLPSRRVPSDDKTSTMTMPIGITKENKQQQTPNAPALSLRPMSSMFNGFAPGMLDDNIPNSSSSSGGEIQKKIPKPLSLQASHRNNDRLAPLSPSITIHSIDGRSSRASSQVIYEDALDIPLTSQSSNSHELSDHHLHPSSTPRLDSNKGSNPNSPANSTFSLQQPRKSIDSTRSESSSTLGLVNGFPATPAVAPMTTLNVESSSGTTEATAMAIATRSKAIEIEGKIAEMVAELVRLRTTAVENGLISPVQPSRFENGASTASDSSDAPNNQAVTPTTPSSLHIPISSCSQCGCHCAEQKRLQTLNEMAILKGISVLDRGRALKPLSNGNAAKFGSYLHR